MKILLAEDDINISTIAKMTLENIGQHNVTHVDNGEDALTEALKNTYDVILLDEMMPKMNGIKVCENINANPEMQSPVIFLSAKSQKSDVELFTALGTGFISKPFDPMTLCQQIDDILSNAGFT